MIAINNILMCKDLETALELQSLGCKLITVNNDTYVLVDCSNTLNFSNFKDRVIFTNKLKF